MLIRAILCLLLVPGVASAGGPRWFQKGLRVEGQTAEVALVRGALTSGRPAAQVQLGEREVLAILDAVSGPSRIGRELAAALGLSIQYRTINGQEVAVAELPEVQIGELRLRGIRARVTAGDRLILGMGAMRGVSVALLASEGQVHLGTGRQGAALLDGFEAGFPLRRQRAGQYRKGGMRHVGDGLSASVEVKLGDEIRRLAVRTDIARSRVQAGILPGIETADGVRRGVLEAAVGGAFGLPASLVLVDGGWLGADADEVGVLGYDLLYGVDLVRVGDQFALREAPEVRWEDPAALEVEQAMERLEAWEAARGSAAPDDRPARMGFGPAPAADVDPEALAFHRELSAMLWKAGAPELSMQRALAATAHAPEQCRPHLELGERRLRMAGPRLKQELLGELVRGPLQEAIALGGRDRACGRARGLLMGSWLAVGDLDRVGSLFSVHEGKHWSVAHLMGVALLETNPRAAEAHLRDAVLAGGRDDVDVRLAMARAQAAQGRTEPAAVWLQTLPWRPKEHPLTAALIASSLKAPLPPLYPEPGLVAAHLAAAAHGATVDAEAVEAALKALAQRDAQTRELRALRAAWDSLQGREPSDLPQGEHLADTWAARAILAKNTGDGEALAQAIQELALRFPEIPAGDLGLGR